MLLKKLRHEKFVMGSEGSSDVGNPSSSTSGGKTTERSGGEVEGCARGEERLRLIMGGGAQSSLERSSSGRFSEGSESESWRPMREWARQ